MAQSFRTLAGIPATQASVKDSVLIIIDAQNEYASGALSVTNLSTSRPAIAGLLEKYRKGNGYIAHIVHSVPEGTPVFTPNTHLAEEFDELKPEPAGSNSQEQEQEKRELLISKKFPGAFAETDLEAIVKKSGKTKVVLVGYMAHVCVSTTAREAHQKGYEVVVVEDAIGDRDIPGATGEQVTKMVLAELGDFFATIVKSSEIN